MPRSEFSYGIIYPITKEAKRWGLVDEVAYEKGDAEAVLTRYKNSALLAADVTRVVVDVLSKKYTIRSSRQCGDGRICISCFTKDNAVCFAVLIKEYQNSAKEKCVVCMEIER